jgi:hypothetical protein
VHCAGKLILKQSRKRRAEMSVTVGDSRQRVGGDQGRMHVFRPVDAIGFLQRSGSPTFAFAVTCPPQNKQKIFFFSLYARKEFAQTLCARLSPPPA